MSVRIVVFGATGYTGELTARALVAAGAAPVLAGRNVARLADLGRELGGLEYVVADAGRPATVAALVRPGDVLISTVGPFLRWGEPAVAAAVGAGAHYLDSTGEPGFIRDVFERWGPRAADAGCTIMTAMGYDYVPGNVAAALALTDAASSPLDLRNAGLKGTAVGVDVGYFTTADGDPGRSAGRSSVSGGTRASMFGVLGEPLFAWRGGRLVSERGAASMRGFDVDGRTLRAVSVGGSEHLILPAAFPQVRDVGVYLGWFGSASPAVVAASGLGELLMAIPGIRPATRGLMGRFARGSTGGPDAEARARVGSLVVAEARDAAGRVVGRARLEGVNPYDFTAAMLAWSALQAAAGRLAVGGAHGPVSAFGLAAAMQGVEAAGLGRVG